MTNLKNKATVYCVTRADISGNSVVVAVTADMDKADDLVGEYEQMFMDRGYGKEDFHFYSQATTFYG